MERFIAHIPNQLKTTAEKNKDNYQHYKDTLDAYYSMSKFARMNLEDDDLAIWYRVYNGEKISEHYLAFEDPYGTLGTTNPLPLNDVKPWNILRPNVDIIINEKSKRPWNYTAVVKNKDVIGKRTKYINDSIRQALEQMLINIANESGMNTGVPSKPVGDIEELKTSLEMSYIDKRAIRAQKILSIALTEQDVKSKLNRDGMKHWCIAGEIDTYKGIRNGRFVYEVINPLHIDFIGPREYKYGRDKEAAIYRVFMPASKIIDNFRDLLTEDEIKRITDNSKAVSTPIDYNRSMFYTVNDYDITPGRLIEVVHCVYRSFFKVGIISYIDEYGEEQLVEVDDTFEREVFPYDIIDEKWEWRTCIDECYRIDGDIYCGMGQVPYTARKLNNPSIAPLPYNRVRYSDLNTSNTSIVKEAYIYQFYWNIYKTKLERVIAVDKGEVSIIDRAALFDYGLGAKDIDKAMYYMEAQHILWIDSRRDDVGRFQHWGSKLSFSQHEAIASLISVLNALRQELDMSMGITPQRRGEVSNSAGKAVTEYALEKSYNISEGLFVDFELFEEEELNDIINIAKRVYSNESGMYIVDGMPLYLDPEEEDIEEEELGIYMSKASVDKVKLEAMRALAQPFAQNIGKAGITPEMVAAIIESDNMSEIKLAMIKANNAVAAYEAQKVEQQMMLEKQKIDAEREEKERQRQFEAEQNALDREASILEKKIGAAGFEQETTIGSIDTSAVMREAEKVRASMEKEKTEREKVEFERKKHNDKMKLEREKIKSREKIEEMKLKNPVPGENK